MGGWKIAKEPNEKKNVLHNTSPNQSSKIG
jgi:hypothetical protein